MGEILMTVAAVAKPPVDKDWTLTWAYKSSSLLQCIPVIVYFFPNTHLAVRSRLLRLTKEDATAASNESRDWPHPDCARGNRQGPLKRRERHVRPEANLSTL